MTIDKKIYLWPQWTYNSFTFTKKVDDSLLRYLGEAQSCLWQALNIYDDIMDNEGGNNQLSLANQDTRRFIKTFYDIKLSDRFYGKFHRVMEKLEVYNQKEIERYRARMINGKIIIPHHLPKFKNITQISDKSLPLALSSLAVLDYANYKSGCNKATGIMNFFTLFLSAKQLSDDVSDWQKDLKRGFITPITAIIMKEFEGIDMENDLEQILLIFINNISLGTADQILKLCLSARKELRKINAKEDCDLITNLLLPLEKSANKSLKFYETLNNATI